MAEIIFNGPAGRLEGRYHHSKFENAPLALVLHPSAEQGGTMNNRLSILLFKAFMARGFSVLRFNFRGVGRSQGMFDNGEGELSDATSALDWLQDANKAAPYVMVGGFAFGSWIGMQLMMRRPEIKGFVSLTPPANLYDFNFLAPCPSSGIVIQGGADNVVPQESVNKLIEKLSAQKGVHVDYKVVDGANHFYHNRLEEVYKSIHEHLNDRKLGKYVSVDNIAFDAGASREAA